MEQASQKIIDGVGSKADQTNMSISSSQKIIYGRGFRANQTEALYRTFHLSHVLYRTGNHGTKTMCYWLHLLKEPDDEPYDPWRCRIKYGKPISIIEIGCGNGQLCNILQAMELDVTGIDIVGLENIYDRSKYKFFQKDLTETPYDFADRQFDYCLCFDVLEHIPEAAVPEILKEMARISSNLIIKVACDGTPPLHITVHPIDWWKEKLEECCPSFSWQMIRNFKQVRPRTSVKPGKVLHAPLFYGRRLKDED